MPTTSISPIKILSDLGFEMVDIETDEDYLSALREGINTIEAATKGSGDRRSEALREELIRVRTDRKKADPNFKVAKKKISAEAFKKGTAIGGAQKVAADTTGASAIVPYRGGNNVGENISTESSDSTVGLLPIVQSIAETVDSIRDTLIDQEQFQKKTGTKASQKAEAKKRNLRESLLESKAFKGVAKKAKKILSPVQSVLGQIIKFLTNIIMGRIVMKFLDWWQNPKNKEKVFAIIKFVQDYWPTLTAAVLLFGTSFGRLVSGLLVKMITVWIPKMVIAIAAMMKNPWVAAAVIGGGLITAGAVTANNLKNNQGDSGETETVDDSPPEKDTTETESSTPGFKSGGLVLPPLTKPREYAKGGVVRGPGGVDKVPARLTAGEFVMSRPAVQKWGANTFAAMNSFGGGNNTGSPSRGYNEGGKVPSIPSISQNMIEKLTVFKSIMEQKGPEVDAIADSVQSLFSKMQSTASSIQSATSTDIPSTPVQKSQAVVITPEGNNSPDQAVNPTTFSQVPIFDVFPTDGGMSQKVKVLGFVR